VLLKQLLNVFIGGVLTKDVLGAAEVAGYRSEGYVQLRSETTTQKTALTL
jgi:hypothetical protein